MKRAVISLIVSGFTLGLTALHAVPLLAAPAPRVAQPLMADDSVTAQAVAPLAAEEGINLPDGYSVTTVESGFVQPLKVIWTPATSWAPAGERFMADHTGKVYRTDLATGQRKVLVDLGTHVNVYADRGLNSIAIDPDYATNKYLYLSYTYENDPSKPSLCKTNTLTRVTVSATGTSAETTILGKVHGGGNCSLNGYGEPVGSACPSATTTDCIPSDFWSHAAGDIRFASDKTMYVTYGDGASYNDVDPTRAYRAQNVDSLAGKVLHVTRSGAGITTNTWAAGRTDTNRSKVWSRGDRNQFRFQILNGSIIGGNVGWYEWEEIQKSVKGGNNGWPCYEGNARSDSGYQDTTQCKNMYNAGTTVQTPLIAVDHQGQGAAIVGGPVITGNKYPADLAGAYIYGDYAQSTISIARFDSAFKLTGTPTTFATNADGPVDLEMGPDGYLYYVAINTGELRRLDYTPGLACGADQWKVQYYPNPDRSGTPTHEVCESASGSPKLAHDWVGAAPSFTPADAGFPADYFSFKATCSCTFNGGTYNFSAAADDYAIVSVDGTQLIHTDIGGTADLALTGKHTVTVEYAEGYGEASLAVDWSQPADISKPGLHIAAPFEGQVFATGSTVNFSADIAVDYKGDPLPASAVSWQIEKHHCYTATDCHVHYLQNSTGLTGSFLMDTPDPPPDVDYVTVVLKATDPATGLSQSVSVDIYY